MLSPIKTILTINTRGYEVDLHRMITMSRLIQQACIESENTDRIDVTKYLTKQCDDASVEKFVNICIGKTVQISAADAYNIICIADEFLASDVASKLRPFIENNDAKTNFAELMKQNRANHFLGPTLIGIVASKFDFLFKNNQNDLKQAPFEVIQAILDSPQCNFPPAINLNDFLIELSQIHPELLYYVRQEALTAKQYSNFVNLVKKNNLDSQIHIIQPNIPEIDMESVDLFIQAQYSRLQFASFQEIIANADKDKENNPVNDKMKEIENKLKTIADLTSKIDKDILKKSGFESQNVLKKAEEINKVKDLCSSELKSLQTKLADLNKTLQTKQQQLIAKQEQKKKQEEDRKTKEDEEKNINEEEAQEQ